MPTTLNFTTPHNGCSAASALEIDIANACTGLMQIELQVPKAIAGSVLTEKAKAATHNQNGQPNSLEGVVTLSDSNGWTAWAKEDRDVILVWLYNFRDAEFRFLEESAYGSISAGTPLKVTLPLNTALAKQTQVNLKYSYGGFKHGHRIIFAGKHITSASLENLCFLPAGHGSAAAETVEVAFTTDSPSNQTALPIGSEVELKWEVKDGVSGKIIGPFGEGATEMPLDFSQKDGDGVTKGSFTVRAVGQQTYLLEVTVKGSPDNIDVLRTLILDVQSVTEYGAIWVDRPRVFPNETVNVHWAAWGVDSAAIDIKPTNGMETTRTVLRDSGTASSGQGFIPVTINASGKTDIMLQVVIDGIPHYLDANPDVQVANWVFAADESPAYPGYNPLEMAFAASGNNGALAICYSDKIVFATDVGATDPGKVKIPAFNFDKVAIAGDGSKWLAVSSLGDKFVALKSVEKALKVYTYDVAGKLSGNTNLPEWFSLFPVKYSSYDYSRFWGKMATVGKQVFIFGGCAEEPNWTPTPVRLDYSAESQQPVVHIEPRLLAFKGADQIIGTGQYLMAVFGKSGIVLGYDAATGKLFKTPNIGDAFTNGQAILQNSKAIAVGDILLLLNKASGAENDYAWNPRLNTWIKTGHGLNPGNDAVLAYRGGDSPRLWAVGGSPTEGDGGFANTVALLGGETFLVPDFFKNNPDISFGPDPFTKELGSHHGKSWYQSPLKSKNTPYVHNKSVFRLDPTMNISLPETPANGPKAIPGCWISGPVIVEPIPTYSFGNICSPKVESAFAAGAASSIEGYKEFFIIKSCQGLPETNVFGIDWMAKYVEINSSLVVEKEEPYKVDDNFMIFSTRWQYDKNTNKWAPEQHQIQQMNNNGNRSSDNFSSGLRSSMPADCSILIEQIPLKFTVTFNNYCPSDPNAWSDASKAVLESDNLSSGQNLTSTQASWSPVKAKLGPYQYVAKISLGSNTSGSFTMNWNTSYISRVPTGDSLSFFVMSPHDQSAGSFTYCVNWNQQPGLLPEVINLNDTNLSDLEFAKSPKMTKQVAIVSYQKFPAKSEAPNVSMNLGSLYYSGASESEISYSLTVTLESSS